MYLAHVGAICAQTNGQVLIGGTFSVQGGSAHNFARLNADGSLDDDFNIGSGPDGNVAAIVIQPDGKIVIAGAFGAVNGARRGNLARLNPDGSLDASFNATNVPTAAPGSLALQRDGRILTGSPYSDCCRPLNAIARYRSDGSLDAVSPYPALSGLDTRGTITSIVVQPDDAILVAGLYQTVGGGTHGYGILARLHNDLSVATNLSATFLNPPAGGSVNSVLLQSDGKIIVSGGFIQVNDTPRNRIARLNPDGSVDTGFDPGTGLDGEAFSMDFQTDAKLLVAGLFLTADGYTGNHVARLNSGGAVDTQFNAGAGPDAAVGTIVAAENGIYIGGDFNSVNGVERRGVARLYRDCQSDIVAFTAAAVAVSESEPAVRLRLRRTGCGQNPVSVQCATGDGTATNGVDYFAVSTNVQFAATETEKILTVPIINGAGHSPPRFFSVTMRAPAGGVILGSPETVSVTVYDDEGPGSLDRGFDSNLATDQTVNSVAVQPDGKALIGGTFTVVHQQPRPFLARLNADGSLDNGFLLQPGPDAPVNAIATQSDGAIFIGGSFTNVNEVRRRAIARLRSDGSLDTNFNPGSGVLLTGGGVGAVFALALQADGKLLVGGVFDTVAGIPRRSLARFNPDGTVDLNFSPSAQGAQVNAIVVQPDGKILAGGAWTQNRNLTRFNADGTEDTGFSPIDTFSVAAVALQPDGKILVGRSPYFGGGTAIVRLNPDGTLDPSISLLFDSGSTVRAILVEPDGSLVLGGGFSQVNGFARHNLARFSADGTLDLAFNVGPGPDQYVTSAAFFADGRLLIGGAFASVDGNPRKGIALVHGYDLDVTRVLEFNRLARASDGTVRLSLSTEPGISVVLQASPDLLNWVSLTTNDSPAGTFEFLDSAAKNSDRRFYRGYRIPR